jgi:hypothetical protein
VLAVLPVEGQGLGQPLPEVDTRLPTGETTQLGVVDVDRADVDLRPLRRPWDRLDAAALGQFLAEPGDFEQRNGLDPADVNACP